MDNSIEIQSTNKNAVANFTEVVSMIRHTHHEVMHLANKAMVDLYWRIGEYISLRVAKSSWEKVSWQSWQTTLLRTSQR